MQYFHNYFLVWNISFEKPKCVVYHTFVFNKIKLLLLKLVCNSLIRSGVKNNHKGFYIDNQLYTITFVSDFVVMTNDYWVMTYGWPRYGHVDTQLFIHILKLIERGRNIKYVTILIFIIANIPKISWVINQRCLNIFKIILT